MKNKYIFLLLFTFFSSLLFSQTKVTGKVIDEKSGKPLPYSTIYFGNKKIGTKADGFGNFTLQSPNIETKLIVSFIGYQKKEISITQQDLDLEIKLTYIAKVSKKNAIIKASRKIVKDTLALRLIRNVINNKEKNRLNSFDNINYNKHTKFEADLANFDSMKGMGLVSKPLKYILSYKNTTPDGESYTPILFRETISKVYQRGNDKKIKVLGVKDTRIFENESFYSLLSYAFDQYSIYDNQLVIANKSFTSPVSNYATTFYRYYVEDSFELEGNKNYVLSFAPKSKEDFGFTGTLTIENSNWAIKNVSFTIDKRANINFLNYLAFNQNFIFHDGKWIINRDEKDVAIAMTKSKNAYKMRFRQVENYNKFDTKTSLHDSIFVGEETDFEANYLKVSDEFISQNRIDSLSTFEDGIYKRIDTFKNTTQYKTIKYFSQFASTAYFNIPPISWEIGRAYQFISWNYYEGTRYRFGARTSYDLIKHLNLDWHVAYGDKDNLFKYGFAFTYNLPKINRRWNQIRISAYHDYQRLSVSQNLLFFDNTLISFFRRDESNRIKDILLKDIVTLNWEKEWLRGIQTTFNINRTVFYQNETYQFNEILENGNTKNHKDLTSLRATIGFRFAPKEPVLENSFNRIRIASIRPVLNVESTIGIKNFWGSQYSFVRYKANIKQIVPYVFGQFYYDLTASSILGRVPYIDLENHGGNNSHVYDKFRFRLMNEGEYISDKYAQLNLVQYFNGFLLNKVPLFKKLQLRENVFCSVLTGSTSDKNKNYFETPTTVSSPEPFYAEAGFGISNIFKIIETQFAWRLTQHDKPTTRKFNWLIGLKFEM